MALVKYCGRGAAIFVFAASVASVDLAVAADQKFDTRLTAVAFDGAMRASVQGDGHAAAILSGKRLLVTGDFMELPSDATSAHIFVGLGIGIPGDRIFDLTVSGARGGTISGSFVLNSKQLTALRSGHFYVQISSQKAPDGNLWGWLMPEHPIAAPDEPLPGQGFLPQLDVPGNWTQK